MTVFTNHRSFINLVNFTTQTWHTSIHSTYIEKNKNKTIFHLNHKCILSSILMPFNIISICVSAYIAIAMVTVTGDSVSV